MSCVLGHASPHSGHPCRGERIQRLSYPRTPTVEQVVVRQCHDTYPCPGQGGGKLGVHGVRIVSALPQCLPSERSFQVPQHDIRSPQERQHRLKRVICSVRGDHVPGPSTKHHVTNSHEREGRFCEGGEMPLEPFSRKQCLRRRNLLWRNMSQEFSHRSCCSTIGENTV